MLRNFVWSVTIYTTLILNVGVIFGRQHLLNITKLQASHPQKYRNNQKHQVIRNKHIETFWVRSDVTFVIRLAANPRKGLLIRSKFFEILQKFGIIANLVILVVCAINWNWNSINFDEFDKQAEVKEIEVSLNFADDTNET